MTNITLHSHITLRFQEEFINSLRLMPNAGHSIGHFCARESKILAFQAKFRPDLPLKVCFNPKFFK